jgi:vacuolar-type H+-ATPase subunit E/Vma4
MSYSIEGIAYDNRNDALTALIANWVSAGGENDMDEIKSALRDSDTPAEIIRGWGGEIGVSEEETDEGELIDHIKTHKADIIMTC